MSLKTPTTKHTSRAIVNAVVGVVSKEASDKDAQPLSNTAYADVKNRKYATHTSDHTLLSFTEALRDGADAHIMKNIKVAANVFGLTPEIVKIEKKLTNKVAQHDYLLEDNKLFPYSDAPSLVKTAEHFVNNAHKLTFAMRKEAALKLLEASDEHQATLPEASREFAEKSACKAVLDVDKLAAAILDRSEYYAENKPSADISKAFDKLASIVEVLEQGKVLANKAEQDGILDNLAWLDESYGYSQKYASDARALPEAVFGDTVTKLSEELSHQVKLANGVTIDTRKIDWQKVAEFDSNLVYECKACAKVATEVLPSISASDADILVAMI